MRRVCIIALAGWMVVLLLAPFAFAQDAGFDAQLFRPSIFGGRFHSIEGAHKHWDLCYGFGLYLNYASSPMALSVEEGDETDINQGVLNAVGTANITAAFMPFWWWGMGVDMPVHFYTRGYNFEDPEIGLADGNGLSTSPTPGDLKAEMKFTFLDIERFNVGAALAPFATFPTGDPGQFLGEGTVNFGGKLLLEINAKIFYIAANGGYLYREERDLFSIPVGSQFIYGAGIANDYKFGLGWSIEAFGSQLDSSNIDVPQGSTAPQELLGNPVEIAAFLRWTFPSKVRLIAGGGGGLTSGVGAPSYRLVAAMDWHPDCIPPATGMLAVDVVSEAGTPLKAALVVKKGKSGNFNTNDMGHFEREASPGEYKISAASKGYLPSTGTGNVVAGETTTVKIVLKPIPKPTTLTINVVHKKSGKPIPGSGILIKDLTTGKFAGLKAPEGTWTGDYSPGKYQFSGVAKGYEKIDVESEVIKEQANVVTIKLRRKIIKIGKIQFAFDSDKLLPPAFPVLDDVVKKINLADFTFKSIIIEGHTSAEGSDEYNLKLSQRRAESVRKYLISKGIPAEKLVVEPYGESRPIAPNDTEEGREKNRRVEFIFEE